MLKYFTLLIGALIIMQPSINSTENQTDQLLRVDREFSQMSAEKGMAIAFDFYMADSAIMLKNNRNPLRGRDIINKTFVNVPLTDKLTWEPIDAHIADSNDLGYTIGQWTYSATDSTGAVSKSYGNYVSIWEKQDDGKWKYVFDTGTSKGSTPHE